MVYSTAPEPALGSWETLCRDKLTLGSEERVSLNVNHLPLPYRAFLQLCQLIPAVWLLRPTGDEPMHTSHRHPMSHNMWHLGVHLRLGARWIHFKRFSIHLDLSWNRTPFSHKRPEKWCTNCHPIVHSKSTLQAGQLFTSTVCPLSDWKLLLDGYFSLHFTLSHVDSGPVRELKWDTLILLILILIPWTLLGLSLFLYIMNILHYC